MEKTFSSSDRISVKEAASLLDISERTIRKYVEDRVITGWKVGKKIYVSRSECVELLSSTTKVNKGIVNWRTVLRLQTDVEKLKAQVSLLNKVNDLQRDPISLDDVELATLYEACMDMLVLPAFKLSDIETWADVLLRLEDQAMRLMRLKLRDPNPAIHFRRLAKRMLASVEKVVNYDNNLSLQVLGVQLKKALVNCTTLVAVGLSDEITEGYSERIKNLMSAREAEVGNLAQFLRPKHQ